ncbi:MAG: hypothetical protein QM533_01830 [Cytophagales bacterium]|nr:hypothetical protein [Cytophagales bacterium]
MSFTTMRINARLDPTTAQRLEFLIAKTGMAVSDVVRASLEHFYNATRKQQAADKPSTLEQMVGRYASDPQYQGQLSRNYKALYLAGLHKKHGKQPKVSES